jgi:hypothetical protein
MRSSILMVLVGMVAAVVLPVTGQELQSASQQAVTKWSYLPRTEITASDDKAQRRLWKWSVVALIAGTSLDAATSMNMPEANPLLRSANGQFGYRALLLKAALASGTIAFEIHSTRGAHGFKRFAILNFIQAGGFAGIAVRNSQL